MLEGVGDVELLLFPDLAVSKKAQRAKDWPMLRRLVEVNYLTFREEAEVQVPAQDGPRPELVGEARQDAGIDIDPEEP
jgi:hypothetical protein